MKRRRSHPRRRKQKRFERLERKLRQGPFSAEKIVIEPPGQVKMSEVLEAFVEPYLGFADTQEDHRKLLTLAITAWNAALLPEEEQKELGGILAAAFPESDKELELSLSKIVDELIARKKAYFSEYERAIVDFELRDTGRGYYLSVASTLQETSLQ